jgi:hypothetical protein
MSSCLCDFLSSFWVRLLSAAPYPGERGQQSMELVLDTISSRQISLEIQDRRCLCEARRLHQAGTRTLFRSKMMEHRRLQAQLLQLQRYRENILIQIDALRNHEINQTIVQALRGATTLQSPGLQDAESALEQAQETMGQVRELSEFLGQPLAAVDVTDDELESELMELTRPAAEAAPVLPSAARTERREEPRQVSHLPLVGALG